MNHNITNAMGDRHVALAVHVNAGESVSSGHIAARIAKDLSALYFSTAIAPYSEQSSLRWAIALVQLDPEADLQIYNLVQDKSMGRSLSSLLGVTLLFSAAGR